MCLHAIGLGNRTSPQTPNNSKCQRKIEEWRPSRRPVWDGVKFPTPSWTSKAARLLRCGRRDLGLQPRYSQRLQIKYDELQNIGAVRSLLARDWRFNHSHLDVRDIRCFPSQCRAAGRLLRWRAPTFANDAWHRIGASVGAKLARRCARHWVEAALQLSGLQQTN